jgi:hypothetical protein
MPGIAGALTRLGLLALPAVPSPSYVVQKAATDTWSLTVTESASVDTNVPIDKAGSDTWSLGLSESGSVQTYPGEKTKLSLLALPGRYIVVGAKSVTSTQEVPASDGWSLTWTEQPTETVFIDTWDNWSLTWNEAVSVEISQTFAASDTWTLNWLDVASVFAGGPITQSVTDTWGLSFTDAATVAATVDATDTWSISITDAATVAVTSDLKSASDTWSLSFALESAFFTPVIEVPILGSDEWRLTFTELTGIVPFGSDIGVSRVITMRAVNRVLRKQ